ncbi:MAG: hypothetical protein WC866_02885 [Patescibacteria group bacterium]|jgi:hypothetical protein
MPKEKDGFNYFDIVRAAIHLVSDPPSSGAVRVDRDGERKAEEVRRRAATWAEEKRAAGIVEMWDRPGYEPRVRPPLKTLYLQWSDGAETPKWHDEKLHINLENMRLYNDGAGIPFLGRGRHGSGAIGVVLFASPVLLLLSPYLALRARRDRTREERDGMSRHATALLGQLQGQLDAETEALLVRALKNEWLAAKKLALKPTFHEARAMLAECRLTVSRFGKAGGRPPTGESRYWHDAEGDVIAHCEYEDNAKNPATLRVCSAHFIGRAALPLLDVCRTRVDNQADD